MHKKDTHSMQFPQEGLRLMIHVSWLLEGSETSYTKAQLHGLLIAACSLAIYTSVVLVCLAGVFTNCQPLTFPPSPFVVSAPVQQATSATSCMTISCSISATGNHSLQALLSTPEPCLAFLH